MTTWWCLFWSALEAPPLRLWLGIFLWRHHLTEIQAYLLFHWQKTLRSTYVLSQPLSSWLPVYAAGSFFHAVKKKGVLWVGKLLLPGGIK